MSNRRTDDPEGFNGAEFRGDDPVLKIGYKEAHVSIRGMSVFLALAVLAIIGATLYSGLRIEQTIIRENGAVATALAKFHDETGNEHKALSAAEQQTSCIITMEQADRKQFRDRYQSGDFRRWCPWVSE